FIHAAVVTASAPPPPATSTLSLHDALPILEHQIAGACAGHLYRFAGTEQTVGRKWQLGAGLAIGILHQTIVTERRRSACVAPVGCAELIGGSVDHGLARLGGCADMRFDTRRRRRAAGQQQTESGGKQ